MFADWSFCPRCREPIVVEEGRAVCAACGFVAYANPAPTASALCVDEQGRLLLARRAGAPFAGCWDLPGGFVEEHEHPLDALRRELLEETGLAVEPGALLGIWIDRYSEDESGPATLNLYWLCRLAQGEPRPADDVAELAWFPPESLPPENTIAFRNLVLVLEAWRAFPAASRGPRRPPS